MKTIQDYIRELEEELAWAISERDKNEMIETTPEEDALAGTYDEGRLAGLRAALAILNDEY